jgi:hypothetical protein
LYDAEPAVRDTVHVSSEAVVPLLLTAVGLLSRVDAVQPLMVGAFGMEKAAAVLATVPPVVVKSLAVALTDQPSTGERLSVIVVLPMSTVTVPPVEEGVEADALALDGADSEITPPEIVNWIPVQVVSPAVQPADAGVARPVTAASTATASPRAAAWRMAGS